MADRNPDFEPPFVGAVCSQCERTEDLRACISCYKTICPAHSMGLGSVSDGYTCSMACAVKGYRPRVRSRPAVEFEEDDFGESVSFVRERPGMWRGRDIVLFLVLILPVVVGIGFVVYSRYQ